MNEQKIRKKIKEVEELLNITKINLVTSSHYLDLLKIHNELWDLLYFKKNQEKDYLDIKK